MKLYAFRPKGFGPYSFFVMAETEEQARALIDAHVKPHAEEYEYREWPDYQPAEVYEAGQVAENDNA